MGVSSVPSHFVQKWVRKEGKIVVHIIDLYYNDKKDTKKTEREEMMPE